MPEVGGCSCSLLGSGLSQFAVAGGCQLLARDDLQLAWVGALFVGGDHHANAASGGHQHALDM